MQMAKKCKYEAVHNKSTALNDTLSAFVPCAQLTETDCGKALGCEWQNEKTTYGPSHFYFITGNGEKKCGTGERITSYDTCEQAAQKLGIWYNTVGTPSCTWGACPNGNSNYPKGCVKEGSSLLVQGSHVTYYSTVCPLYMRCLCGYSQGPATFVPAQCAETDTLTIISQPEGGSTYLHGRVPCSEISPVSEYTCNNNLGCIWDIQCPAKRYYVENETNNNCTSILGHSRVNNFTECKVAAARLGYESTVTVKNLISKRVRSSADQPFENSITGFIPPLSCYVENKTVYFNDGDEGGTGYRYVENRQSSGCWGQVGSEIITDFNECKTVAGQLVDGNLSIWRSEYYPPGCSYKKNSYERGVFFNEGETSQYYSCLSLSQVSSLEGGGCICKQPPTRLGINNVHSVCSGPGSDELIAVKSETIKRWKNLGRCTDCITTTSLPWLEPSQVENAGTCRKCDKFAYLHEGVCVSSCPSGYYGNSSLCHPCPVGCATCSNLFKMNQEGFQISCSECTGNFKKDEVTDPYRPVCVQSCPVGMFNHIIQNGYSYETCQACAAHCAECSDLTHCTKAGNGWFLDSNLNIQQCLTCPDGKYSEFSMSGQCLKDVNKCIYSCEAGCKSCKNTSLCVEPASGYYLVLNRPFKCTSCDSGVTVASCTASTDTHCCDKGCKTCFNNAASNTCIPCSTGCKACYHYNILNTTRCTLAEPGFLLRNDAIEPCSQNCSKCTFESVTRYGVKYPPEVKCTRAKKGFILENVETTVTKTYKLKYSGRCTTYITSWQECKTAAAQIGADIKTGYVNSKESAAWGPNYVNRFPSGNIPKGCYIVRRTTADYENGQYVYEYYKTYAFFKNTATDDCTNDRRCICIEAPVQYTTGTSGEKCEHGIQTVKECEHAVTYLKNKSIITGVSDDAELVSAGNQLQYPPGCSFNNDHLYQNNQVDPQLVAYNFYNKCNSNGHTYGHTCICKKNIIETQYPKPVSKSNLKYLFIYIDH